MEIKGNFLILNEGEISAVKVTSMAGLMGRLRFSRMEILYLVFIVLAVIIKVLLSLVAVASYDFRTTIQLALRPPDSYIKSPWIFLQRLIYLGWDRLSEEKIDIGSWIVGRAQPAFSGSFLSLIFLLKLPVLILDVACGYIIYLLTMETLGKRETCLRSYALWMVNPYVILMGEMDGSNDLLPLLFILFTLLLYIRGRRYSCCIPLWAGISAKFYPFFIAPILAILSRKEGELGKAMVYIGTGIAGLGTYFYLVGGWSVQSIRSLALYTPATFLISEMMLISKTMHIGLATTSICVYLFLIHHVWSGDQGSVLDATLGLLLAYFAFLNWFPPYLMIAIPFLTLKGVQEGRWLRSMAYWLLTAFLIQILVFDVATENSLFYIYNHGGWMERASSIIAKIRRDVTVEFVIKPLLRALFAALSLFYAAKLLLNQISVH